MRVDFLRQARLLFGCGSAALLTLTTLLPRMFPSTGPAPFPDSPNVYSRVEQRPCVERDPATGSAVLVCFAGLAGNSAGKTCLWGVDYKDGRELNSFPLCTLDCVNDQLRPDNPCSNECFSAFQGRVAWRSAGALEPAQQTALGKSYDALIALVNSAGAPARYRALGGDAKRTQLKQAIVKVILEEMLPLNTYCVQKQWTHVAPVQFVYETEYTADISRGVQAEKGAYVPLATDAMTGSLQIFESAFYKKNESTLTAQNPDELAAELLHEMVHWTQNNYGYGQALYKYKDPMHIAQSMLYELMAYDLCSQKAFFRRVLTDGQRRDLVTVGLTASINKFDEVWDQLSRQQQKDIANWAWSLNDGWMRRAMLELPGENGGVWGCLCAANQGSGPCGMVANK